MVTDSYNLSVAVLLFLALYTNYWCWRLPGLEISAVSTCYNLRFFATLLLRKVQRKTSNYNRGVQLERQKQQNGKAIKRKNYVDR